MRYEFDYTGVRPMTGNYALIPEGWYPFRIVSCEEGESSSHEYQVKVFLECADDKNDTNLNYWVTFKDPFAKGAGMALHFLKCIGEPYEGKITVDPQAWVNKMIMGKVRHDEYNGEKRNKLASISPMRDLNAALGLQAPLDKTSDVPF